MGAENKFVSETTLRFYSENSHRIAAENTFLWNTPGCYFPCAHRMTAETLFQDTQSMFLTRGAELGNKIILWWHAP